MTLMLKTVFNCRMCRRKEKKCGFPSPVKSLYRLDFYENVSSKYHSTDVFPSLYVGKDMEPNSLSDSFLLGGARPPSTKPVNHFQHRNCHYPETLQPRAEYPQPTFMLTNTFPLLSWPSPLFISSRSWQLMTLMMPDFFSFTHCTLIIEYIERKN